LKIIVLNIDYHPVCETGCGAYVVWILIYNSEAYKEFKLDNIEMIEKPETDPGITNTWAYCLADFPSIATIRK
jgi:hypothetical protein